MFEEMKKDGSRIPMMVEYLRANGWQTYKHHDNWVKSIWDEDVRRNASYDLHQAFAECTKEQLAIQDAFKVLTKAIKEDKSLYIAYQANIAMAFQDEFHQQQSKRNDFTKWLLTEGGLHTIANNAADCFLNLLLK